MAVLAKGLPILFIPEKLAVAAMGNNMIDHGRRSQHTGFQTFGAQRMPGQERLPRLSPVCVITPGSRAAANGVMAPFFWFFTETWGIDRKRVEKRSMKD